MKNKGKILSLTFAVILCLSFVLSILDVNEFPTTSDFNHDNIRLHVERMSEFGPHSIVNKVENKKVQEYIISELLLIVSGAFFVDLADRT